jgi:hypothetical protein
VIKGLGIVFDEIFSMVVDVDKLPVSFASEVVISVIKTVPLDMIFKVDDEFVSVVDEFEVISVCFSVVVVLIVCFVESRVES